FFEKLQINDADAVAIGSQTITARFIQPLNQTFGAQFGKVVSQGSQAVFGSGAAERFGRVGMDFSRRETVLSGNVRETDQGMHQGELPGLIEFKAWDSFAVGKDRRLYQCL